MHEFAYDEAFYPKGIFTQAHEMRMRVVVTHVMRDVQREGNKLTLA